MCVWGGGGYKTRDSMYVLNIVFFIKSLFPHASPRLPGTPVAVRTQITLQAVAVTVTIAGRRRRRRYQVQRVHGCRSSFSNTGDADDGVNDNQSPFSSLSASSTFSASLAASTRPNHTPLPTGRAEWPAARERRRRYPPELQLRPDRGPGVHPAEVRGSGSAERGLPFALVCQAGGGHGGIVSRHNLGQHLSGTEAGVHTHSR